MAVTMKNAVFWDVAPCRSCVIRRFGGTYRFHLLGRKIRERVQAWAGGCRLSRQSKNPRVRNQREQVAADWVASRKIRDRGTSVESVCSHLLTLVLRSRIFLPRRWKRYVPPKRQFTQDLHGATSQKQHSWNKFIPNFEMILSNIIMIWSTINLTIFAALCKIKLQNPFIFCELHT
jgi:hypothetical protein